MTSQMTRNDTSDNQAASINDVLRAQLDALTRIESILAEEHEALRQRSPEALLSTADAKAAALASLGELESRRKAMSANLDAEHLGQLRVIAARCRNMNRENAALLVTQQQHLNRLLGLLRGSADNRPSSYDASGKASGSAAQQLRLTQA